MQGRRRYGGWFRGLSVVEVALVLAGVAVVTALLWRPLQEARMRHLRDAILVAVRADDGNEVTRLLQRGAPIDGWTSSTPHFCVFCWVLANGNQDDVLNAFNSDDIGTVLWRNNHADKAQNRMARSARDGEEQVVAAMLAADVEPAGWYEGWSPLQWAAYSGHAPIVTMLIETGIYPLGRGDSDETAADLARRQGHHAIAERIEAAAAAWGRE